MASDVGGLGGVLVSIFFLLSSIWNFNSLDNMMVSNLFVVRKHQPKEPKDKVS